MTILKVLIIIALVGGNTFFLINYINKNHKVEDKTDKIEVTSEKQEEKKPITTEETPVVEQYVDDNKIHINDILLILIENLLMINHIGERITPATNVEKTNNVFTLLPDSSIPVIINLSMWFVTPHKNEANIVNNTAEIIFPPIFTKILPLLSYSL